MIRVATRYGVIFKLAEIARERDVLGATDVLVAEEQNLVLEKQSSNLCHETGVRDATPRLTLLTSAPMAHVSGSTRGFEFRTAAAT